MTFGAFITGVATEGGRALKTKPINLQLRLMVLQWKIL